MSRLAEWGHPEPADLGPREQPALLGKAATLIADGLGDFETMATQAAMSIELLRAVVAAGSVQTPRPFHTAALS
jgi:hypothetical protein